MSWEIPDMCRACMKVGGVLLPMYDDDTISRKNLPFKLAELTSIQIDRFDGLPNMLCPKCAYRTDAFYEFKQQVRESETKLRNMFKNDSIRSKDKRTNGSEEQDVQNIICNRDINEKTDVNNINYSDSGEELKESVGGEGSLEINVSHLVDESNDNFDMTLKNVLLDKVNNAEIIDQERGQIVKNEIPEEISRMLQEQNLDYTIMYISEEDINSVIDSNNKNFDKVGLENAMKLENIEEIYVSTDEAFTNSAINKEILDNTSVTDTMDSKNIVEINAECKDWNSELLGEIQTKQEYPGTNEYKTEIIEPNTKEEGSDSDSDYFIDPKDNLLGSLNDTITRIKEIKCENDVIQYQCTLCLQNYDKLTGVLLHTIDNHVPSTGPFYCVVCEKDCDSHRELRTHVKTHTGKFPYSCFICNKAYSMKRYLKRHMVCHTDFPRFRCPKCGTRYKTKSELECHVTTHSHGAPFACSQCPRLFNHKGNYKRHLITHLDPQGLHLPKYPCEICGKRFLNNRTLNTHMRVHTGEKPFKCEVCGRSFSQQGNLLNHVRIHANPRSYTCEVCGKRFNQRATLKDHSLLHTGEKPYVCNVCGVAFTFSAALRRHMWTHAGGKPFGCEICKARFVGKYDLRRHMRVHTGQSRAKGKKNVEKQNNTNQEESPVETILQIVQEQDSETVLVEQILLTHDVMQVVPQEESEKENVDALFSLIQYGE